MTPVDSTDNKQTDVYWALAALKSWIKHACTSYIHNRKYKKNNAVVLKLLPMV